MAATGYPFEMKELRDTHTGVCRVDPPFQFICVFIFSLNIFFFTVEDKDRGDLFLLILLNRIEKTLKTLNK